MPIYEFYCAQNHTVYQFYAKTLAQGKLTPQCPDNPRWPLKRVVSQFAFTGRAQEPKADADLPAGAGDPAEDARMEAAMNAMEKEFDSVDENDPRAMARMMRRMSELTGEKIDGEMEEVVRKLEEGVDPEALEDSLGAGAGDADGDDDGPCGMSGAPGGDPKNGKEKKEARMRWKLHRAVTAPRRDPKLYDYA
jgi:hypothetical protein